MSRREPFIIVTVKGLKKSDLSALTKETIVQIKELEAEIAAMSPTVRSAARQIADQEIRKLYTMLNVRIMQTEQLHVAIQSAADNILGILRDNTPVSESRAAYLRGTHRNHGATKAGWFMTTYHTSGKYELRIYNEYPNRVRLVEHGFTRPAIAGKTMAWQMATDDKLKVRKAIRAHTFHGLFFVKAAAQMLSNAAEQLLRQFSKSLVDNIDVQLGPAYNF